MKIQKLLLCLLAVALVAAIAVPMAFAAEEDINLMYDDRKELSSLVEAEGEVVISNEVVTSCQVGSTTPDEHVLVYQDGVLYAVGTGTATLTVGEKSYNVTVAAAPISLFMITGHSQGAGQGGNGSQSVVVEAGQAYSSYHQNSLDVTEIDGYGLGWGSANRVGGEEGLVRTGWDSYGHIDSFAPGMGGTTGTGSGFAYQWNKLTGEKVWVINIAIGGSCINEWLPGSSGHNTAYDTNYYDQTVSKFTYAQTILKNEVAAGHYTLSKQGILNFYGANFSWYSGWSMDSLQADYQLLSESYNRELNQTDIDGDGMADGLDVIAFTSTMSAGSNTYDKPVCTYFATSQEYSHAVMISKNAVKWRSEFNLTTFPTPDYPTQSVAVAVPESLYHTNQGGTSDNSLLCSADKTHYSQVGFNAIGLDMAANLSAWFEKTPTAVSVRLEKYDSSDVGDSANISVGQTYQLTPFAEPVYVSDLTYEVTGAAELTYPLAVKGTEVGTATLTVKQGSTVLRTVTFNVTGAHTHCQCGGTLTGTAAEQHTCSEALSYVPLTKEQFTNWRYTNSSGTSASVSTVLREGNYYLDGDFSTSTIYVAPGQTVNICLNGHKLTTSARSFSPNGNLNICDCSEDASGQVYSKRAGSAPVLYGYSGSVTNIYGGTFSSVAPVKREFAGCMAAGNDLGLQECDLDGDGTVDNATKGTGVLNIWGGKLIGSDLNCADGSVTAYGSGGCIYVVSTDCTLNVYGGELVGGDCVPVEDGGTGGGGVIANAGICNIYGGKFTGSTDNHGAIWTRNSRLTVSGSPEFADNKNADIFLHYCDHFYVGDAGLQVETPICIDGSVDNWTQIHLTDEAQEACFTTKDDQTFTRTELIMKVTRDNTYCECGGTMTEEMKTLTGHVCEDGTWSTLTQANLSTRFTTSSSKYNLKSDEVWLYLSSDVNLSYPIEVTDGKTLHIDLNGYTLSHSNGTNAMLRTYGTITICDSRGGGKAVGVRTGTNEASCVYVLNYKSEVGYTPELHLYSGTLTAFNITSKTDRTRTVAKQAGVLQIGNNSINKLATFNMYGGTITGGTASANGGNVYLGHGVMNMYGGVIENGTSAGSYGGNIRVGSSNFFTMYGGTVRGGTTQDGNGGNIYLSSGTNSILGGTVENGWASSNGGNVYLGSGTLTVADATITGGCATQGGNMYLNGGTADISDTVMRGGMAGYTFTRNADGTLAKSTEDAPSGNAGNLYVGNATANLTDCTLENGISYGKGVSNGFGGNCYNKGTLTMDTCTVSGGEGFRGGVVGIRDNGTAASYTELKNCTFFDNSASVGGSSVSLWANTNGAQILIESCTFDDSMNGTRNGVLQLTYQDCTADVTATLKDVTVNNNNPDDEDSYALYGDYGTFVLEGNCVFNTDDADICLIKEARLVADDFTPAEAATVTCGYTGQFGTSATDKSSCFTSTTQGVTWAEGSLYINGLLKGTDTTYNTFAEALAAGETVLTLLDDHEGSAELAADLYLDLNGFELTGDITGSGTLYGMDSATDGYTTDTMGRLTGTVSCNVSGNFKTEVTGSVRRYMAIKDDTGYTFHRFYLGVTHMNLKPGVTGVGYKAIFAGDDMVKEQIAAYGFNLWVGEGEKVTASKAGSEFVSMEALTLRLQNFDVENYGEVPVNTTVFITLYDGTTIESAEYSYTLRSLLETINDTVSAFTAEQLAAVRTMCQNNSAAMDGWDIGNILN